MPKLLSLFFTLCIFPVFCAAQNPIVVTDADLLGDNDYFWTADNEYLLDGHVFLEAGGTLTIEPGTVVRGRAAENITTGHASSLLVIARDAKIFADGTEENPIVFTAEIDDVNNPFNIQHEALGLWGGVAILGRAKVATSEDWEGLSLGFFSDSTNTFNTIIGGGLTPDPEYSAGSFTYVSVRYAGETPEGWSSPELKGGVYLGALGTGTIFHHVECIFSNDWGIFIQGGSVNVHHLVGAYSGRANMYFLGGYQGRAQFLLALGGYGLGVQGPFPSDLQSETAPDLANVSVFNDGTRPTNNSTAPSLGFAFNSGASGRLRNSLIVNVTTSSGLINETASGSHPSALEHLMSGNLVFKNNHFNEKTGTITDIDSLFYVSNNIGVRRRRPTAEESLLLGAAPGALSNEPIAGRNETLPLYFDPVPFPGVPILTGGEPINEEGFEAVDYQGAFGPDDNWLTWTLLGSLRGEGQPISGRVRVAENDCVADAESQGAGGVIVRMAYDGFDVFTTTDAEGNYQTLVPAGDLEISVVPPGAAWASCPPVPLTITGDTTQVDLSLTARRVCVDLAVDIATSRLRRGFNETYFVTYENVGAIIADNARVSLVLGQGVNFASSGLPLAETVGDTLYFDVGNLPFLEGPRTFEVLVIVDQNIPLGAERCATARITSDIQCPPDGGAQLVVTGTCEDNSIIFRVTNVGDEPLNQAAPYIVIEDEVMLQQGEIYLPPGQFEDFTFPAIGSATLHFATTANPNDPQPTLATATESCSDDPSTPFSYYLGPTEDRTVAVDCLPVTGSYDPNDKRGLPAGLTNERIIPRNITMDYRVRFQNTGTDTAYTVVVIDTLSPLLDPASIKMGASSHDYLWTLEGERTLKVTYNNILLPDSTTNEPASNGFFKFSIEMVPEIPYGTLLENVVDIYFDFNEPVRTNTTEHLIDLLPGQWPVGVRDVPTVAGQLKVFPQPANEVVHVQRKDGATLNGTYALYDQTGKRILAGAAAGAELWLPAVGLPSGVYYLIVTNGSGKQLSQKVVVNR